MPTTDLAILRTTATLPQVNGNGSAGPNNGWPPDREGFDAPDPGTGPEIFAELWASNGPYEEPWMAAFNAEVWGGDQSFRNDATGHSYET